MHAALPPPTGGRDAAIAHEELRNPIDDRSGRPPWSNTTRKMRSQGRFVAALRRKSMNKSSRDRHRHASILKANPLSQAKRKRDDSVTPAGLVGGINSDLMLMLKN